MYILRSLNGWRMRRCAFRVWHFQNGHRCHVNDVTILICLNNSGVHTVRKHRTVDSTTKWNLHIYIFIYAKVNISLVKFKRLHFPNSWSKCSTPKVLNYKVKLPWGWSLIHFLKQIKTDRWLLDIMQIPYWEINTNTCPASRHYRWTNDCF